MKTPLRALLIEDSPADAALLLRELERGNYTVTAERVETAAALQAALAGPPWDIVFCDYSLPDFSGEAALEIVKASGLELPFIFVSGTIGEEVAVAAMRAGAQDYVMKSNLARLGPAVERELWVAQNHRKNLTKRKQLEAQFRQSQKMEGIGQLAGGVAHDFNNLLTIIRGNAELVLLDAPQLGERARDNVFRIIAASERAANLTRQLLAFGRKQIMQAHPLNLNEAVVNLTKMLDRIIGEDLHLECHYCSTPPFVNADVGMIEQVLLNLVVNARDAMPRGGTLGVTTATTTLDASRVLARPEAREGEFIILSVTDTGTGIAPEHLPHIFEPFYTTKAVGKGTGLGLATVYGIVKQHQGWIEVSARPAAGTTFSIFLPAIPPPVAVSRTIRPDALPRGGTEMILLVEDEAAVRLPVRRVLENSGYRVVEAACAREALETWTQIAHEVDLLLTDVVMPDGVTGYDLSELLQVQKPSLRVLYVSGYSADVAGKNLASAPLCPRYFLQKPFATRALLETVRHCLDETQREATALE